jgi:ssDNA-binding Zn-finger/Zn-ribbon topoisomerase 1
MFMLSKFPECLYSDSITTDWKPASQKGKLNERRNKRGQNFYGCSKFPACRYTTRRLPQAENTTAASEQNGTAEGSEDSDMVE